MSGSSASSTSISSSKGRACEAVDEDDDGRQTGFIFRGTRRPCEQIFRTGFIPRGTHNDLSRHVRGELGNFISTSKSPKVARALGGGYAPNGYYLYTIRAQPHGLDVNAILGEKSPYAWQLEIAVPGGIPSRDIMGARRIKDVDLGNGRICAVLHGPFIPNPNYVP